MHYQEGQLNNNENEIESQFKNFIKLLQCGNQKSFYKSEKSDGKLSIIYSASQPQSSEADKQNSNQSSNRSPNPSQFESIQKIQLSGVLKQLSKSGLTKKQQKLIQWLCFHIEQLTKTKQTIQQKNSILQQQLLREKKGTDQLLQALMKMDEQAKQFWNTYYQLSDQFNVKSKQLQLISKQNQTLKEQNETYKKDIKFMKKLVYIANERYQELETQIQQQSNHTFSRKTLKPVRVFGDRQILNNEQNIATTRERSLQKIGIKQRIPRKNNQIYSPYSKKSKDIINRQSKEDTLSSYSPVSKNSRSQKSNKSPSVNCKQKQNMESNFKQVYRKMIIKTLKPKK